MLGPHSLSTSIPIHTSSIDHHLKVTMPPKSTKPKSAKPVATTGTPRPSRVAKEKASATIQKTTIAASGSKPHPITASSRRAVPSRTIPSTSFETSSGGELSDHATPMEDIQTIIQGVIAEAFASGADMPTAPIMQDRNIASGVDTVLPTLTSSRAMPQQVLARWSWILEDTIKTIALGKFEIDSLPKLHRLDDLRNAYLKRSMKGIYQPLDGGPPDSSFRDPTTCFLAWLIYISIRAEFKPEMGSRLTVQQDIPAQYTLSALPSSSTRTFRSKPSAPQRLFPKALLSFTPILQSIIQPA
jgi:hypothetical protein